MTGAVRSYPPSAPSLVSVRGAACATQQGRTEAWRWKSYTRRRVMSLSPSAVRVAYNHLLRRAGVPGPMDLRQLANRIERLQHTRTHGWHPADELQFKNLLPGSRGRQVLPDPKSLRDLADGYPARDEDQRWLNQNWRNWIAWAQRAEGLIRDNDPRNPKRMVRDMARGRFPHLR